MRIGLINYSIGNIGSVYSAFRFHKYQISLISNAKELDDVDIIVLAGVGNFVTAVRCLKDLHFWNKLNEEVLIKKKPVLGICLSMHLFSTISYEGGENKGFDWISGKVVKIQDDKLRVPHMGWNQVACSDKGLIKGVENPYFYFMHSYHFVPDDQEVIIATTNYYLKIDPELKKLEARHEGVSDAWIAEVFDEIGVEYWDDKISDTKITEHLDKQIKIVSDLLEKIKKDKEAHKSFENSLYQCIGQDASVEFYKKNLDYLIDRFEMWEGDTGTL